MKTDILIDEIELKTEIKTRIHIDPLFLIISPKLHIRERQQLHETLLIKLDNAMYKNEPGTFLFLYRKLKSREIKGISKSPNTLNLLKEKLGNTYQLTGRKQDFLNGSPVVNLSRPTNINCT